MTEDKYLRVVIPHVEMGHMARVEIETSEGRHIVVEVDDEGVTPARVMLEVDGEVVFQGDIRAKPDD